MGRYDVEFLSLPLSFYLTVSPSQDPLPSRTHIMSVLVQSLTRIGRLLRLPGGRSEGFDANFPTQDPHITSASARILLTGELLCS